MLGTSLVLRIAGAGRSFHPHNSIPQRQTIVTGKRKNIGLALDGDGFVTTIVLAYYRGHVEQG